MRDILDRYYTPDLLAKQLIDFIGINNHESMSILEPSVGGGSFLSAVSDKHKVYACDIDPSALGLSQLVVNTEETFICDFLDLECSDIDWIIGNPPYREAEKHCLHAIKNARKGVAFLLRLGFLASVQRAEFWKQNPPTRVIVLSKRPSFTCDGKTDGSEYAFFVWEKCAERKPVEWI